MRQGMIYREEWGAGATLYAGAAGTLPRSGEVVPVANAWDGGERAGIVTPTLGHMVNRLESDWF